MKSENYYLIRVAYLGFRYSGWQIQPGTKTVEGMLSKTLNYILPNRQFKILGAGRTDAKVSSMEGAFELFMKDGPLESKSDFLKTFNDNLPSDIKVFNIKEVNQKFNIIQDCEEKEYTYFFSYGSKNHPLCAPFMTSVAGELDIEIMKEGAKLFKGTHNFRSYTSKDSKSSSFERSIQDCRIEENTLLQANFFPDNSYVLRIRGKGFLRYQVRMIMGALFQLGLNEIQLDDIRNSLKRNSGVVMNRVAPGSGLILNSIIFSNPD